jgi:hypothetical protein
MLIGITLTAICSCLLYILFFFIINQIGKENDTERD